MATKKKTMAKVKATKRANGKAVVMRTLNFKVPASEAKAIKAIAEKYTRGNVTALIRIALPVYRPKKKLDLDTIRPSTR